MAIQLHSPFRRALAALVLVSGITAAELGSLTIRWFPEAAVAQNRSGYRRFLVEHGATIVSTDSASLQQTLNDCGIAVVREALRALGVKSVPSHDSVARLVRLTAVGTTLVNLARAIELSGGRATFQDPDVLGLHLHIAHLSIGHFVLVRGISNGQVRFFDPMVGEVAASASVFWSLWSGHGFAVTMGEVAVKTPPNRSARSRNDDDFSPSSMERKP